MTVSYSTVIRQSGNNTGIEVPADKLAALGAGKRPRVRVQVEDYHFVAGIGAMNGAAMLSFSKAHRDASGLQGGQTVRVTLEVDSQVVSIDVPPALADALERHGRREIFDALAPSKRKEHARQVSDAKTDGTRDRRIAKIVADLG